MSFFGHKGDDSNLQYDDTAFLYFIASFISVGAVVSLTLILRDLFSLKIQDQSKLEKVQIFRTKLIKLKKQKRSEALGKRFIINLAVFVVLVLLIKVIFDFASQNENKLKGFDPFEILGVPKDASLRDIKKAYRKLAMEFHPDKNIGNVQAQNKFILISKSYECFTDETKKANCFKYGNPDGEGSFRVGIGLPQFFINVQYKYYVLPIVLTIFLVLIPWGMISWNNKTKVLDHDGISISSYNTFFKCFCKKEPIDRYTFLYIMTSFPELYQDPDCRPITPKDKQELQRLFSTVPAAKKWVFDQLNDNQLDILWQLTRYCGNIADFRSDSLRRKVEYYIGKTANMILLFATRPQQEGETYVLYENPDWEIRYLGPSIIEQYLQFQRDYYNRTLLLGRTNFMWIYNLDLGQKSKLAILEAIKSKIIPQNLFEIISSPEKTRILCELVAPQCRKSLENQLKQLPIYQIDLKLKVAGQQKESISNVDYASLYFRIRRTNKTSGYTLLNNYPYPKKDSVYLLAIQNNNVLFLHKVDFPYKQDEFIQKFDYRTGKQGTHQITVYCIHQAIFQIDTVSKLSFKVTNMPEAELEKPIQFHPDDIHMEKLYKNFFETLVELDLDPEENELSDSEEEEQKLQPMKKKHNHNHEEGEFCSDQSSDDDILD